MSQNTDLFTEMKGTEQKRLGSSSHGHTYVYRKRTQEVSGLDQQNKKHLQPSRTLFTSRINEQVRTSGTELHKTNGGYVDG